MLMPPLLFVGNSSIEPRELPPVELDEVLDACYDANPDKRQTNDSLDGKFHDAEDDPAHTGNVDQDNEECTCM